MNLNGRKCKVVSRLNRVILTVVPLVTLGSGGCANAPDRAWWPQGPGNAEEVLGQQSQPSQPEDGEGSVAKTELPDERTAAVPERSPADSTADQPSGQVMNAAPAAMRFDRGPQSARYGNLLFVSGQVSDADMRGPGSPVSIAAETRSVMDRIRAILAAENLTMTNIVSATIFVTNLADLPAIQSAYDSYFPRTLPASSVAEVRQLPGNARLQISVIAGR